MGGKEAGGPVTLGYHYYLSMQLVVCQGPVDYIKDIRSYENTIIYGVSEGEQKKLRPKDWEGTGLGGDGKAGTPDYNTPSVVTIQKPNLYGGIRKEGGVGTSTALSSTIYILWGGSDQPQLDRLAALMDQNFDIASPPMSSFSVTGGDTSIYNKGSKPLLQALIELEALKVRKNVATTATGTPTAAATPLANNLKPNDKLKWDAAKNTWVSATVEGNTAATNNKAAGTSSTITGATGNDTITGGIK